MKYYEKLLGSFSDLGLRSCQTVADEADDDVPSSRSGTVAVVDEGQRGLKALLKRQRVMVLDELFEQGAKLKNKQFLGSIPKRC